MDGTLRKARRVHNELVDDIDVGGGRRAVDPEAVTRIAASMQEIGLRVPISVRVDGEAQTITLVTGAHRLAAAKHLGWEWIETFRVDGDDIDARMEEIAENLHRAELTAVERSAQIEEWRRLCEERAKGAHGGQPHDRGKSAIARQLGISRQSVDRAEAIASLSDEAKEAARTEGMENATTALVAASKETEPARQAAVIHDIAEARRTRVDADVKDRAAREVAEMIAEYVPGAAWNNIKANLYAAGASNIANALTNVTGHAVMDEGWS